MTSAHPGRASGASAQQAEASLTKAAGAPGGKTGRAPPRTAAATASAERPGYGARPVYICLGLGGGATQGFGCGLGLGRTKRAARLEVSNKADLPGIEPAPRRA
jgi:hypothetical protein